MDVKAILDKISQDARGTASKIMEESQKRADALQKASDGRVEQIKSDALDRAKKEGALMRERMLRMAELEDKKEALSAKREVMDRAFESALSMLENMEAPALRALLLNLAKTYAQGDETLLIGDKNAMWYDDAFLSDVNAELKKGGRQGALQADKATVPGVGFALKKGGTQINCTMDALLIESRMGLETDVARVLFS